MSNINNINENNKKLTKLWLIQSVGALALSGFFAIFLVLARSPEIGKFFHHKDFFRTCLTIHVNLSVLIWLTSFICTMFASRTNNLKAGYTGFSVCATATVIVALSIFDVSAEAYLNNYVPMLDSDIFKLGINLYIVGLLISSLQALDTTTPKREIRYFDISALFIIIASVIAFVITYANLELPQNKGIYNFADYYERLFWGFGHIIQFLYVAGMMAAFTWVYFDITKNGDSKKILNIKISAFILNLIFALTGIYIIYNFEVTSAEYINNFTKQMVYFAGIAPVLFALVFIPQFWKNFSAFDNYKPERNAILWSMILFAAGGIISGFIEESNTIIPAHYHGSIIGVSLALMAACYRLMPKLGYGDIKGKIANIQPILYGFGQLLHIIGFAISGGYGALRKAPGQELAMQAKIYMGLMGLGGLISIIGGLLFIIIIFRNIFKFRS